MKTIKSGQYICYCLWQRLANFFCKWPDNIHFGALQATGFVTHTVNPLHTNIQFVTFQRQERAFQHQVWVKLQLALSLLLLTILQLYRLSPPLPPLVSNCLPVHSMTARVRAVLLYYCAFHFCCCSAARSCLTFCDPTDCSTLGFPVLHHLPDPAQTRALSWWCHPTISSSLIPFSSCLQSFSDSGSFPMSHFFASSGQSIGVSAWTSVLPMNIQDWFSLGLTGCISLQSKRLSKVFTNTTV